MVDLAKEAFITHNYDLAADIYQRTIQEYGPKTELYLGLADCYAHNGQLRKALDAYKTAFRLGSISPDRLNELVEALVKMVKQREDLTAKPIIDEKTDMFSCGICKSIIIEPVTILCGHSFCKKCIGKEDSKICKKCGMVQHRFSPVRTNVLLQKLIEQWFPNELSALRLKDRGNKLFLERKYKESIDAYSEAFKCAPSDHLLASNRSHAYAVLEKYKEALADAELAVKQRPDWPKAYYRKGVALSGLSKHEDAAFAYLQCLSLDPSITTAKSSLAKELHYIVSPLAAENLKHVELQSALNPSPFVRAFGATADSYQSLPVLNVSSLEQLKSALREKLIASGAIVPEVQGTEKSTLCNQTPATVKCVSAPSSRPGSPGFRMKSQRSSSEYSMLTSVAKVIEGSKLSRKRSCESLTQEKPCTSPTSSGPSKQPRSEVSKQTKEVPPRPVDRDKLRPEDFECSLCIRLLYQPVTTPCGHTFCKQCLERCLDHTNECPLCKSSLAEYLAERKVIVTEALEKIIQTYFQKEFQERKKIFDEEIEEMAKAGTDNQYEIPIFVCTLAYPTVTCPLHVFEPRYRLMIRRCMESGARQFGMCICLEDHEENFADYGTLLEIRDVQYFMDGRSVVDTVGGKRFKVISRSSKDGYNTAKVEFLEDTPVAEEDREEVTTLMQEVYAEAREWFNALPQMPRSRIEQYFGRCPELDMTAVDTSYGPAWLWYMTAVLPLDQRAQLTILAMNSLKERLLSVRRVLNYIKRRGSS